MSIARKHLGSFDSKRITLGGAIVIISEKSWWRLVPATAVQRNLAVKFLSLDPHRARAHYLGLWRDGQLFCLNGHNCACASISQSELRDAEATRPCAMQQRCVLLSFIAEVFHARFARCGRLKPVSDPHELEGKLGRLGIVLSVFSDLGVGLLGAELLPVEDQLR